MPNKKRRILCVEDSPEICSLAVYVLTEFDVVTVSSYRSGLEKAEGGDFALILLDHYLPDGLGADLCVRIREFDRETPIIFITNSPDLDETKAKELGAAGIVRKAPSAFVQDLMSRVDELAQS